MNDTKVLINSISLNNSSNIRKIIKERIDYLNKISHNEDYITKNYQLREIEFNKNDIMNKYDKALSNMKKYGDYDNYATTLVDILLQMQFDIKDFLNKLCKDLYVDEIEYIQKYKEESSIFRKFFQHINYNAKLDERESYICLVIYILENANQPFEI
jgi:hypothetical protein